MQSAYKSHYLRLSMSIQTLSHLPSVIFKSWYSYTCCEGHWFTICSGDCYFCSDKYNIDCKDDNMLKIKRKYLCMLVIHSIICVLLYLSLFSIPIAITYEHRKFLVSSFNLRI